MEPNLRPDDFDARSLDEAPCAEERLLDEIYEAALFAYQQGRDFDTESWRTSHPELGTRVAEIAELAREVCARSPVHKAPAPRFIAGYQLVHELGRGGMGTVWLARQAHLGDRKVALKLLPRSTALSTRARERFWREARALARISHPNVVQVYDVIEEGESLGIAMDWVDGRSVADLLRALRDSGGRRLSGPDAVRALERALNAAEGSLGTRGPVPFFCRLTAAVARAAGALHREGLVHRDIKPSNVLVRKNGRPLLSDFGLVRDLEEPGQTQTGQFIGTPAYSSPEQLRGDHDRIDARSDVFALGATLYELLTLSVPFKGRSSVEILAQAEAGSFRPLRTQAKGLPRDLETIVATALAPEPARRYASADDLADDLERLLRFEPIRARRAGLGRSVALFLRRERARLVPALVVAFCVALTALFLGVRYVHRLGADGRARAMLKEARLHLLDPTQMGRLYEVAHPETAAPRDSALRVEAGAIRTAMECYATALDEDPTDEALSRTIRLESEAVEWIEAVSHGDHVAFSRAFREACPNAADFAAYIADRGLAVPPEGSRWALASAEDRRLGGLLAFLCGEPAEAVEAWGYLSPNIPPDPLADAALGELYLSLDRPQEAYPRLVSAAIAFPEAGFIVVELADAAVQSGEIDAGERLLADAGELSRRDTRDASLCTRADIAAARGQDAQSLDLYEEMVIQHRSSTSYRHFARFLADRQDYEYAIAITRLLLEHQPLVTSYRAELLGLVESWWAAQPGDSTSDVLTGLLEHPSRRFGGVFELLATVRSMVEAHSELRDSSLWTPGSSSSLGQRRSFASLALSIGGMTMDPNYLSDLNPALRRLHAQALLTSFPRLATRAVRFLGDLRHSLLIASAALLPAPSVRASEGWTSFDNGPANQSRADDVHLSDSWQELWRVPHATSTNVLVSNGIVVFQDDLDDLDQFVAVDLATGSNLWTTHTSTGSQNGHYYWGCVAEGRFFVPSSKEGTGGGKPPHDEIVDCFDLATGVLQWTWNSGENGNITHMQAFFDASRDQDWVVLTAAKSQFPQEPYLTGTRIIVLDPRAPTSQSALHCLSAAHVDVWSAPPPAVLDVGGESVAFSKEEEYGPYNGTGGTYASRAVRAVSMSDCSELPGFTLSQTTLSQAPVTANYSPVVLDTSNKRAFLTEDSGRLRGYDLAANAELSWSPIQVTTTPNDWDIGCQYLPDSNLVVVIDYKQKKAHAYDATSGQASWTASFPGVLSEPLLIADDVLVVPTNVAGTWQLLPLDPDGSIGSPLSDTTGAHLAGGPVVGVGGYLLTLGGDEIVCYTNASQVEAYCTAGTSASGCMALLTATGTASASAPSGFVVSASIVEGQKDGLFFYAQNGRQANPWGNGTSYQCVTPPVNRGGLLVGGGTLGACDGALSQDLNARWCPICPKPAHAPTPGVPLQIQLWYRDPANTSNQTTSLSDALEVVPCP